MLSFSYAQIVLLVIPSLPDSSFREIACFSLKDFIKLPFKNVTPPPLLARMYGYNSLLRIFSKVVKVINGNPSLM